MGLPSNIRKIIQEFNSIRHQNGSWLDPLAPLAPLDALDALDLHGDPILAGDNKRIRQQNEDYIREREWKGFLPNARELCEVRGRGRKQCWEE